MKKVIGILAVATFVSIFPIVSFAVQGSEDSNGANNQGAEAADETTDGETDDGTTTSNSTSTQNSGYNFSDDSNIRTAIKTRVLENNPGVGEMTMEEARVLVREEASGLMADKIQASKPDYTPKSSDSKTRKSEVVDACEEIIILSAIVSNVTVGQKLENVAKTYLLSEDKVNKALDIVATRTSIAKFFIGPNYNELQTVQTQIEQNQTRIQEMNQIHTQIQNETDQTELKVAIQTLEAQNTTLQEQLDDEEAGFSLFGWLIRWINI